MILRHEYPVCEFDTSRSARINASEQLEQILPERCVITFFRSELNAFVEAHALKPIACLHSEVLDIPIYEHTHGGQRLCVTMPFSTAPGAAGTLEELHAMGCGRFIVCGGAGCLAEGMEVGGIILPASALRDEGTSYHYLKPSREVACHKTALETVKRGLNELGIPFTLGKTWTTDAFYRETPDLIALRKAEGCLTVEMEAAAFFAVSNYYDLPLAQLLYAGDDVSGPQWDPRSWNRQYGVRANLISAAIELVTRL